MIIIIIVIFLFFLLFYYSTTTAACCNNTLIPIRVEAQQLKPHELKAYEKRIDSVTQIPAL